ncbi:hypothetical protein SAMN04488021_12163 [Paracoccus aminovorans]|uniref:Uncharacterized protein n=1 Tax=Paracoccus aminovorans TaxID=34004 RepID=A0A1I3BFW9_9RHOB|nr:hypothetical protein SAMN04488021_12163 [Paracoccus aminovorans]
MSPWTKPDSRAPAWIATALATEPLVAWAEATSPGTPQAWPVLQARAPGGAEIASASRLPMG